MRCLLRILRQFRNRYPQRREVGKDVNQPDAFFRERKHESIVPRGHRPQQRRQVETIRDRLTAREVRDLIARYEELKPRRGTTDVSYAAHAATADAIEQLLVDFDAVVPGLVSDIDGSVTYAAFDDAEVYSVVDEVARRALCTGARVLAASREQLPEHAPLTAILRYQFM